MLQHTIVMCKIHIEKGPARSACFLQSIIQSKDHNHMDHKHMLYLET
jgi:hypothetical protein